MKKYQCLKVSLLSAYLCLIAPVAYGADSQALAHSRALAEKLVSGLATAAVIEDLELTYAVEMDCEKMVRLKTKVNITMSAQAFQRSGRIYLASFSMKVPKSKGAWSWLAMNVLGGYEDEEYKDMVRSLNVKVEERFSQSRIFRTICLKQVIIEKNYANQTPIELDFNSQRIRFWENAEDKSKAPELLPYQGQVGPLTGFFNYLLRYGTNENFCVVNILNRARDTGKKDELTGLKFKVVEFMFRDEPVTIGANTPCPEAPFGHLISFKDDNFLDIVYGKISFDMIIAPPDRLEKVPFAISVDGVFSKNKKHRRDEDMKALRMQKGELAADAFDQAYGEIASRNILSAWNIRCYLESFVFNGIGYPSAAW